MTDIEQTPPDEVLIEAGKRCGTNYHNDFLRGYYHDNAVFRTLCDMIWKYEPPVDRKVLCAQEAYRGWDGDEYFNLCVRAIELYEEGFGK